MATCLTCVPNMTVTYIEISIHSMVPHE